VHTDAGGGGRVSPRSGRSGLGGTGAQASQVGAERTHLPRRPNRRSIASKPVWAPLTARCERVPALRPPRWARSEPVRPARCSGPERWRTASTSAVTAGRTPRHLSTSSEWRDIRTASGPRHSRRIRKVDTGRWTVAQADRLSLGPRNGPTAWPCAGGNQPARARGSCGNTGTIDPAAVPRRRPVLLRQQVADGRSRGSGVLRSRHRLGCHFGCQTVASARFRWRICAVRRCC